MDKYSCTLRRLAKELDEDFVRNCGPVSMELADMQHDLERMDLNLRKPGITEASSIQASVGVGKDDDS